MFRSHIRVQTGVQVRVSEGSPVASVVKPVENQSCAPRTPWRCDPECLLGPVDNPSSEEDQFPRPRRRRSRERT